MIHNQFVIFVVVQFYNQRILFFTNATFGNAIIPEFIFPVRYRKNMQYFYCYKHSKLFKLKFNELFSIDSLIMQME